MRCVHDRAVAWTLTCASDDALGACGDECLWIVLASDLLLARRSALHCALCVVHDVTKEVTPPTVALPSAARVVSGVHLGRSPLEML